MRSDAAKVWVNASSLALGTAIQVGIIEDASWLRLDIASYINMAELDAVINGLNLALAWQMRKVELMTIRPQSTAGLKMTLKEKLHSKLRQLVKC